MALQKQREGLSAEFHLLPLDSREATIGDPEIIKWTSINHLCASEVADATLSDVYGIKNKRLRDAATYNVKVYIKQAYEFYKAAKSISSRTAPLFYYYSFLNLAKAVCEMKKPKFHKRAETIDTA